MKASMHLGRGKASHNDRRFDLDKADHIDQERTALNFAYNFSSKKEEAQMPFEEFEHLYYMNRYSDSLTTTNEKYLAQRHADKVRTMDDWYKTYKPTEAIIQLGNAEEQIDHKYLVIAFNDMLKDLKEKYPQMVPLNIAIHRDEATPHIHLRFVIEGHDKSGHLKPLKTKGLKEMGLERPDLSKPEGRYNNPLMSFTNEMREILYRKIEALGLDLDRTPHLKNTNLPALEYKKKRIAEDIRDLEFERTGAEQSFKDEKKQYEEVLTGLQENYEQQKAVLQAQYEAEQTRLSAKYAEKKKQIAEREAKLIQREKDLSGRTLEAEELEALEKKNFWSAEDKKNVIKTAKLSAKNAAKAEEYKFDKELAVKEQKALRKENKELKKQIPTIDEHETYLFLKNRVQKLEEDIKVRDEFIRDRGLMPEFIAHVKSLGIKLAEMVEEMKHAVSTMKVR